MQKDLALFPFVFLIALLSGCTSTFMGTVLIITFSDVIYYVAIAFIIAILIALFNPENKKKSFWIGFLLSLVLTPLVGFIYLLIKITSKN